MFTHWRAGGTPDLLVLNPGKGGQYYIPIAGSYGPPNLAMLAIDGGTGYEFQLLAFGSFIAMGEAFGAGPPKMGDTAALENILTSFVNDPSTGWGVYGAAAGQVEDPPVVGCRFGWEWGMAGADRAVHGAEGEGLHGGGASGRGLD